MFLSRASKEMGFSPALNLLFLQLLRGDVQFGF